MAIGVGIEVGPTVVRGAVIERSGSRTTLLAVHVTPCDTANPDALTRALSQLRRLMRPSSPIILGLPSTSAILTTLNPLVVNSARSVLAVQFELQQQLPYDLGDAAWHYQWLSRTNGHQSELRVQGSTFGVRSEMAVAAAIRRSLLNERLACCRRAGFSIGAVTINAVATLNAWALKQAHRPGLLLNVVSEQLAEWILWTPTSLQVVPVAITSAHTMLEELATSWEVLRAQLTADAVTICVIGSSMMVSQLQTRVAMPPGWVIEPLDVSTLIDSRAARLGDGQHSSAAAVGLALQGVGLAQVPLNVLERFQIDRRARQVQHAAILTSGVLAVAAFGLGLSGMLELRHRQALQLESLEHQEQMYQTLRPELRTLLQRQQRLQRRTLQLERLRRQAPAVARLLAQVAEALPDTVWLTKLDCAKTGAVVEGQLEGRAKSFQDVTVFFDRLKTMPGVLTVKPLSSNVVTDTPDGKESIAFSVQLQQTMEKM